MTLRYVTRFITRPVWAGRQGGGEAISSEFRHCCCRVPEPAKLGASVRHVDAMQDERDTELLDARAAHMLLPVAHSLHLVAAQSARMRSRVSSALASVSALTVCEREREVSCFVDLRCCESRVLLGVAKLFTSFVNSCFMRPVHTCDHRKWKGVDVTLLCCFA